MSLSTVYNGSFLIGPECSEGATLGTSGAVFALTIDSNENLYIGGAFDFANREKNNCIVKYSVKDSTWEHIGGTSGNPDDCITDIKCLDNYVYVVGRFTQIGNIKAKNIAMYDSSDKSWHTWHGGLGTLPTDIINTIYVRDGGAVYVGGNFTDIGCKNFACIGPTSSTWSGGNISDWVDGPILALAGIEGGQQEVAFMLCATGLGKGLAVLSDSGSGWSRVPAPYMPQNLNLSTVELLSLVADVDNVLFYAESKNGVLYRYDPKSGAPGIYELLKQTSPINKLYYYRRNLIAAAGANFYTTYVWPTVQGNTDPSKGVYCNPWSGGQMGDASMARNIYACLYHKGQIFIGGNFNLPGNHITIQSMNTSPSISVTSPTKNLIYTAPSLTISGTYNSSCGVDYITMSAYKVDTLPNEPSYSADWDWRAMHADVQPCEVINCQYNDSFSTGTQNTGGTWTGTFTHLVYGNLVVNVVICDIFGVKRYIGTYWYCQVVDVPTLAITSPINGATVYGDRNYVFPGYNVMISGTCTNANTIIIQDLTSGTAQEVSTTNISSNNATWSVGPRFSLGLTKINVIAKNAANQTCEQALQFYVTTDAIAIQSTSIAVASATTASFSMNVHNAKSTKVSLYEGDNLYDSVNASSGTFPHNQQTLKEQTYKVIFEAWQNADGSGEHVSVQTSFIFDVTPPILNCTVYVREPSSSTALPISSDVIAGKHLPSEITGSFSGGRFYCDLDVADQGSGFGEEMFFWDNQIVSDGASVFIYYDVHHVLCKRYVVSATIGHHTVNFRAFDSARNRVDAQFSLPDGNLTYTLNINPVAYIPGIPIVTPICPKSYPESLINSIWGRVVPFWGTCDSRDTISTVNIEIYQDNTTTLRDSFTGKIDTDYKSWSISKELMSVHDGIVHVCVWGKTNYNQESAKIWLDILRDTVPPVVYFKGAPYTTDEHGNCEISTYAIDATSNLLYYKLTIQYPDGSRIKLDEQSLFSLSTKNNESQPITATCQLKKGINIITAWYWDSAYNYGYSQSSVTSAVDTNVLQIDIIPEEQYTFTELPLNFTVNTQAVGSAIASYFVDFYPGVEDRATVTENTPFYRLDLNPIPPATIESDLYSIPDKPYELNIGKVTINNGASLLSPILAEHLRDGKFAIKAQAANLASTNATEWRIFELNTFKDVTPPAISWTRPPTSVDNAVVNTSTCQAQSYAIDADSNLKKYKLTVEDTNGNVLSTPHEDLNFRDPDGNKTKSNQNCQVPYTCQLQLGTNVLRATYEDEAGNAASIITHVTYTPLDTTPPAISWTRPPTPTDNVVVNTPTCQAQSYAIDADSNLKKYKLTVEDTNGNVLSTPHDDQDFLDPDGNQTKSNQNCQVPYTCQLQLGVNVLRATYEDEADNVASIITHVTYNTIDEPDDTLITFDKPENYTFAQTPMDFKVTVDSTIGLKEFSTDYFYAWTLPSPNVSHTDITDGTEFYRLENINGQTPIQKQNPDIQFLHNKDSIQLYGNPQFLANGGLRGAGEHVFFGIPFNCTYATLSGYGDLLDVWWSCTYDPNAKITLEIPVDVAHNGIPAPVAVCFLMNTTWGSKNPQGLSVDGVTPLAEIVFEGTGGVSYTKRLTAGNKDIRDYGSYTVTNDSYPYAWQINNTTTKNIWTDGSFALDMIRVDLPSSFFTQRLTKITIHDNGTSGTGSADDQRLFMKALTVLYKEAPVLAPNDPVDGIIGEHDYSLYPGLTTIDNIVAAGLQTSPLQDMHIQPGAFVVRASVTTIRDVIHTAYVLYHLNAPVSLVITIVPEERYIFTTLPFLFSVDIKATVSAIASYSVDFYPGVEDPTIITETTPFYRLDLDPIPPASIEPDLYSVPDKSYELSIGKITLANGALLPSPILAEHLKNGKFVIKARATNLASTTVIAWRICEIAIPDTTPPAISWTRPPTPNDNAVIYESTCQAQSYATDADSYLASYKLTIEDTNGNVISVVHEDTALRDLDGNKTKSNQNFQVAYTCQLRLGINILRATYVDEAGNSANIITHVTYSKSPIPTIIFDKPENYIFTQIPMSFKVTVSSEIALKEYYTDYFYGWTTPSPNTTNPPTEIADGTEFYRLEKKTNGNVSFVKTPVEISGHFNANSVTFPDNPIYPLDTTDAPIVLLGVPFSIPSMTDAYNTWLAGDSGASLDITGLTVVNATTVYLLMNTKGTSADPDKTVSVVFTGSGGATFTKTLRENEDIRNYNSPAPYPTPNTNINGTTTRNVWIREDKRLVLDMVEITLPSEFSTQILTGITITDNTSLQRVFVKGITVITASGAGDSVADIIGDHYYSLYAGLSTVDDLTQDGLQTSPIREVHVTNGPFVMRTSVTTIQNKKYTAYVLYNLAEFTGSMGAFPVTIIPPNEALVYADVPVTVYFFRDMQMRDVTGLITVNPDPGGVWTWAQDTQSIVYTHVSPFPLGDVTADVHAGLKDVDNNDALPNTSTFTVVDDSRPMITHIHPINQEAQVDVDEKIIITFSKPMNFDTLRPNCNITLCQQEDGNVVALANTKIDLDKDGKRLLIEPLDLLTEGTTYQIFVENETMLDITDQVLLPYPVSVFTTVMPIPFIVTITPPGGALVFGDTKVTVFFSHKMRKVNVSNGLIYINPDPSGTWTWAEDQRSIVFEHAIPFIPGDINVVVNNGLKDINGRIAPITLDTFTVIDKINPTVMLIEPVNQQVYISVYTNIKILFSKLMKFSSIVPNDNLILRYKGTTTTVLLSTEKVDLNGDGKTLIIRPAKPLANNTVYEIIFVNNSIFDTFNNALLPYPISTFTTGMLPPFIVTINPPDGAFGVPTDAMITVFFSHKMTIIDTTSPDFSKFIYTAPDPNGIWTWLEDQQTLLYTHDEPFSAGEVKVVINAGVKDVNDEDAPPTSATFTVVDTNPVVVFVEPRGQATQIALDTEITIEFSKPMKLSSIVPNTNIILRDQKNGIPIALSSSKIDLYGDGKVIVFKPLNLLIEGITYEIVIMNGNIFDTTNNALLFYPVSSFTTKMQTPFIVTTIPPTGAQVFGDVTITILFSRIMQTINANNLISVNPNPGGAWSWSQDKQSLVYQHTGLFAEGTVGIITSPGFKDIYDNDAPTISAVFTVIDRTSPVIISIEPVNQATEVPLDTTIKIVFSKAMNFSTIIPNSNIILYNKRTGTVATLSNSKIDLDGDGKTLVLEPISKLTDGTSYEIVVVNEHILDTFNNPLLFYPASKFTTEFKIPFIVSINPSNDAEVLGDTTITVLFSREMQPIDTNGLVYVQPDPGGSWAWSLDRRNLTYSHVTIFEPGEVSIGIRNGFKDIDNDNAPIVSVKFMVVDKINPIVLHIEPIDQAVQVSIDTIIKITFSKQMNFDTIIPNGNIILREKVSNNIISLLDEIIDLNGDKHVAVLTPEEPLDKDKEYVIQIITPATGLMTYV